MLLRTGAGLLCALSLVVFFVRGEPTLSFGLRPLENVFGGLGRARDARDTTGGYKAYSGRRVKNDTVRMVYYNEQTIAVVELGPKRLLLNCELIEVYEPEEAINVLEDLQKISRPYAINFDQMIVLMDQCQEMEKQSFPSAKSVQTRNGNAGRGLLSNSPFTLFSGIVPGTKWCGTGDIAESYHELGSELLVDVCCRTHDLCPVKVRAYAKRYNVTNANSYTKSHCMCDDRLYKCLKRSGSPLGNIMGNVYFNLMGVACVEDTKDGRKHFRSAMNF